MSSIVIKRNNITSVDSHVTKGLESICVEVEAGISIEVFLEPCKARELYYSLQKSLNLLPATEPQQREETVFAYLQRRVAAGELSQEEADLQYASH